MNEFSNGITITNKFTSRQYDVDLLGGTVERVVATSVSTNENRDFVTFYGPDYEIVALYPQGLVRSVKKVSQ